MKKFFLAAAILLLPAAIFAAESDVKLMNFAGNIGGNIAQITIEERGDGLLAGRISYSNAKTNAWLLLGKSTQTNSGKGLFLTNYLPSGREVGYIQGSINAAGEFAGRFYGGKSETSFSLKLSGKTQREYILQREQAGRSTWSGAYVFSRLSGALGEINGLLSINVLGKKIEYELNSPEIARGVGSANILGGKFAGMLSNGCRFEAEVFKTFVYVKYIVQGANGDDASLCDFYLKRHVPTHVFEPKPYSESMGDYVPPHRPQIHLRPSVDGRQQRPISNFHHNNGGHGEQSGGGGPISNFHQNNGGRQSGGSVSPPSSEVRRGASPIRSYLQNSGGGGSNSRGASGGSRGSAGRGGR